MREDFSHKSAAICLACLMSISTSVFAQPAPTQESPEVRKQTVEPVFRVPKIKSTNPKKSTGSSNAIFGNRVADLRALAGREKQRRRVAAPAVDLAQRLVANANPTAVVPRTQPLSAKTGSTTDPLAKPLSNKPLPEAATNRVAEAPSPDKQNFPLTPELDTSSPTANSHPLDRAIDLARDGLENMQKNIHDYTAILVKRERVDNALGAEHYMKIKVRNRRQVGSKDVPFSIYMRFIKPRGTAGREVIWVEGQNNNNLIAHETSPLLRFKNFHLQPDGMLAMRGNRYPIYDAGLENLTLKLIEKAERDRAAGVCEVNYIEGYQINKRRCTVIEVIHHERKAPFEFHRAEVYIDEELQIPVRYASYDWPVAGSKPPLMEEYTYFNVKLNVGLTDKDFDIANSTYNFAK